MTQMHGYPMSEPDEFPELSLEALTGGEIQMDMDLSEEPKCRGSLMNSTATENIYLHCEFPDLDWIHAAYNGHIGKDSQGRMWTWNEDGVSLVESEDPE
jgi:hypothetical protein